MALLNLAACSSGAAPSSSRANAGVGGDSAPTTAQTSTGGAGGTEPVCQPPSGIATPPKAQSVGTLDGALVDLAGMPVVHVPAQICGVDVCLAGSTDDQGKVSLAASTTIDRPKFKVGDGLTYARLAFAIPEGSTAGMKNLRGNADALSTRVAVEVSPCNQGCTSWPR